jgi:hypothetical protein
MEMYYVTKRKAHLRRARTKNRNTQIAHLHYRVSHYRVIRDALLARLRLVHMGDMQHHNASPI